MLTEARSGVCCARPCISCALVSGHLFRRTGKRMWGRRRLRRPCEDFFRGASFISWRPSGCMIKSLWSPVLRDGKFSASPAFSGVILLNATIRKGNFMPSRWKLNERQFISRELEGEHIVLHLDSGNYFTIEGSGALIFRKLLEGAS